MPHAITNATPKRPALCEDELVNFGELVRPAESAAPGLWIAPACGGSRGTVGNLVPQNFETVVRVLPPEPEADDSPADYDWWADYRQLFEAVVVVGGAHTETPDRAWFATWEGYGFDSFSTLYAKAGPVSWKERREIKKVRAQLKEQDRQTKIEIRAELAKYPLLKHPIRAYYVMEGPLEAVKTLRYPGPKRSRDDWRNPDMIWPDDRSWIIVTDVDFWSLYVAGSTGLVDELTKQLPDHVQPAAWTDPLPIEV